MATQTKAVSGNVTTYVITDQEGGTATVAVTQGYGSGTNITTMTLGGTGIFHKDGQLALTVLLQLISTGIVP
jgi:hypothetical protein